jgi:hypothetical protein
MTMIFLALFATLGYIFFPLVMLGAIVGVVVCVRSSYLPRSTRTARRALLFALTPWFFSIIGAITGIIVVQIAGDSFQRAGGWGAVGQTFLAGFIVTLTPLILALRLFPRDAEPTPATVVE